VNNVLKLKWTIGFVAGLVLVMVGATARSQESVPYDAVGKLEDASIVVTTTRTRSFPSAKWRISSIPQAGHLVRPVRSFSSAGVPHPYLLGDCAGFTLVKKGLTILVYAKLPSKSNGRLHSYDDTSLASGGVIMTDRST
jgi:hypothetical protein